MDPKKEVARALAEPVQIDKNTAGLLRDNWLEQFAVGFRDNVHVLDTLMPEKPVKFDSAKYRVYSPKGYFKTAAPRGETALPEQSALQYTYDTYTCEEFAMEGWVSDDAMRNAADDISPLQDESEFLAAKIGLTNEVMISQEIITSLKALGTDYYTNLTTGAGGTNWLGSTAVILSNYSTAVKAIVKATGRRPNMTFMNTDAYEAMVDNSSIKDMLKYTNTDSLKKAMPVDTVRGLQINLADALVNVGTWDTPTYRSVLYDVSVAGTILKNIVVTAYVKPGDKLTAGTNFVSKPVRVYRGRGLEGDRRQSTLVAAWKKFTPKLTNPGAVYLFGTVLG